MRRLFALLWLALALAVSSGPAFAAPSHDCPMAASQHMQGHHEEMDCCKVTCAQDCAAVCPTAVKPSIERAVTRALETGAKLAVRRADTLRSAELAGADPPPRTTFS